MAYAVELIDRDQRTDFRTFKTLTGAQNQYFRALAALRDGHLVQDGNGELVLLIGCSLYELATDNLEHAKQILLRGDARLLRTSDDPMRGRPINIRRAFATYH